MPTLDKAISGTVVWADLATPDLDKARTFYGELLGWSYVGGDDARTGYYTTAQVSGRRVAAIWKRGPEQPGPAAWSIYFGTDDADDTARKVSAAGGQVLTAPMDVMEYGRMAMFADPTGAVFGVWQSRQHSGAQLVNEPGAMAWHEVYTRDVDKAREFYARVFGLEQRRLEDSAMQYWTLHKGPITACGLMQMTDQFPKEVAPHWNTYFAVNDADASTAKLQQLGGKVFQPAFDTPYGRMSAVADPLGVAFCLIEPSNPG